MPDPRTLRDSTQIVLPCDLLESVRDDLEAEFVVSVHRADGETCRIIGSPVEIRAVSDFLARQGISLR
ncbi:MULTISPECIES: VNG_1110C family protein [Haloferax]|jgi:hypothetical protein|uniref:Uncharacterized protein n=6 Tax=Haloferax TaxID=2251 RepID=D4GUY9_HALVD|nr:MULTISPECIES: hypothetical protein [Haloferax]ADE03817.1 uncharacterized protein HVO_0910 [Haloferax volcanii DS2]ELK55217.1 hypothetical protein D320_05871 [Haloferax sp. BAB-2207]ELY26923.1 hypothetical protein C498_14198 [Haloferax volcanii DS2]ELZ59482.1 hypothetical protein C460_06548 [Haloferax sp. ATCC BAA-646]ELZ64755.1 hypothetical protein C459_09510 [Haloferax sp. ATCC BAA-645]